MKVRKLYSVIIILIIIIATGCSGNKSVEKEGDEAVKSFKKISQKEAYDMMHAQEQKVIIIDVRTQEEYDTGYIKGAELMTLDRIDEDMESAYPDKEAVYLVYCRSGNRSQVASSKMIELGYKNIYEFGGIKTWEYEIIK